MRLHSLGDGKPERVVKKGVASGASIPRSGCQDHVPRAVCMYALTSRTLL